MDRFSEERIKSIWRQNDVPVIYRRGGDNQLLVKLPYSSNNMEWLREDTKRKKPIWIDKYKCWETPKSWFNDLVDRLLIRFGKVYIIQPYREQEKCAPACWNAKGHECQCSCMGEHHGSGNPSDRWFIVSETFATRWHDRELACRLLIKQD